ncbi:MAG: TolB-like 6-bladed beta-propeller domain-containing protein [Bacteroidales bacterium]|nr:TolB-like 6-bladed beta-propeller domain-containing protein [Bacteroidales bacterium]
MNTGCVKFLSVSLILIAYAACSSQNAVNGLPVKFVVPEKVLSIDRDSSFKFDFPENNSYGSLYLGNNSILFISEIVSGNEEGAAFYKAYSLCDFSYLGAHLTHGRGPGEFLFPELCGRYRLQETEHICEYIYDSMLKGAFAFDLVKSLEEGRDVSYPVVELSGETFYVYSYQDCFQLIVNLEHGRMFVKLTDRDGTVIKQTELYPGVCTQDNCTQLCFAEAINEERGILAMFMLSLPQINFLDIGTGEMKSVAVDKAYRRWDSIINVSDIESVMNSSMYYSMANCTSDYIIASYRSGITHYEMMEGDTGGTHLHVFNWNGDFLYDISLKETIGSPVYDSVRKHLYAIDYSDERICRYDLSCLLM